MVVRMTTRSFVWLSHPIIRLVAVVSISLLLAACGQGGSGGNGY